MGAAKMAGQAAPPPPPPSLDYHHADLRADNSSPGTGTGRWRSEGMRRAWRSAQRVHDDALQQERRDGRTGLCLQSAGTISENPGRELNTPPPPLSPLADVAVAAVGPLSPSGLLLAEEGLGWGCRGRAGSLCRRTNPQDWRGAPHRAAPLLCGQFWSFTPPGRARRIGARGRRGYWSRQRSEGRRKLGYTSNSAR